MRRLLISVLAALSLASFVAQAGRVAAASPAEGDGSDGGSSATFTRGDSSGANTSAGNALLATFFVATGDGSGTYVCILHPEWGRLSTPAPP